MDRQARKAAAAAYKERKPAFGVFAIVCRATGEAFGRPPLPSADACHWWSPAEITTAPRLLAFEPDVTVQRVR